MNQNLKISFLILIALGISFSVFVMVIQYFYENQITSEYYDEEKYYNSITDTQRKIFILGSSHVNSLDPYFIENELKTNNENYQVYNLGKMANRPQRTLDTIDLIISAKPDIIVYGIAARDFVDIQSINQPSTYKSKWLLPDPSSIFDELVTSLNKFNMPILESNFSPKLVTVKALRGMTEMSPDYIKAPFFRFDYKRDFTTMPDAELKSVVGTYHVFVNIEIPDKNNDVIALKKIINKLKTNNIELILFTTPQHKYWLENISYSEKKSFDLILEDIENNTNFKINSLIDKYSELDIWRNPTHIAVSKVSSIYSKDITKIILDEVKK